MLGHHPLSEFGYGDIGVTFNNDRWPEFDLYIKETVYVDEEMMTELSKTLTLDTSSIEVL